MTRTVLPTPTSAPLRSRDEEEIRSLIRAQFDSLNWTPDRDGDWLRFETGFIPAAQLFAAKRPAGPQSAHDFTVRLKGLRDDGVLKEFSEKGIGCAVHVFGSVAMAAAGCEMIENGASVTRDVSLFLLVKNPEGWRIAAQAWDVVEDIPSAFASAGMPIACTMSSTDRVDTP